MLENISHYNILLASNSPRRRELLSGLGIKYQVVSLPEIDESYPDTLTGAEIPTYIAQQKAQAYVGLMNADTLLITADTIVWHNDKVYGKPTDAAHAKAMLRELSGHTHTVITGVAITSCCKQQLFAVESKVTFDTLDEEEIEYYVAHYNPIDKAGAYGIQEWIGYIGVTGLEGSYFNVMGLPIQRLYKELKNW